MKCTQVGRVISHQPVTGVSYQLLHNADVRDWIFEPLACIPSVYIHRILEKAGKGGNWEVS